MKNEKNRNRVAVTATYLEPDTCNAPLAKKKAAGHAAPCRIHVHSLRNRLADIDGISAKAAIDGIVHAGILDDDSPEFLQSVSYSQEKTKGREETRITIEWDESRVGD